MVQRKFAAQNLSGHVIPLTTSEWSSHGNELTKIQSDIDEVSNGLNARQKDSGMSMLERNMKGYGYV